jgi:APA family basic amino acid/polyamine antiporter
MIMGMIPATVLQHSTSPFADAAKIIFGQWGDWLIAAGAAISCLGALNGWCLLQGQIAMAAADNKMFPSIFGKRNRFDVPATGLIITALLITALLLLTSSPNLVHQFDLIILLATLASLLPYFYTCMAQVIILKQKPALDKQAGFNIMIAILAAIYSGWAILGSGMQTVFYGTVLLLSSVPIYIWVKTTYK